MRNGIQSGSSRILDQLNVMHDIQYKIVGTGDQICEAIKQAAKTGPVATLVIGAHGNSNSFTLSSQFNGEVFTDGQGNIAGLTHGCFTGLAPQARINLLACDTGFKKYGIAYAIAKMANRLVTAPFQWVSNGNTLFTNTTPSIMNLKKLRSCTFSSYEDRQCAQI